MAARTIEAPDGGQFLDTRAAAKWLGVSVPTFRKLVGLIPDQMTLPGVREWLRPNSLGRWYTLDIAVLAHLLSRRAAAGTQSPAEGEDDA